MIKRRIVLFGLVFLISALILSSGCSRPKQEPPPIVRTDPCENIQCPDICKGEDLWSQKCVDGACVDFVRIEPCSEKCGCVVDLCQRIKCYDECRGEELWAYKCVNGICAPDYIKEKCAAPCGCGPKYFYNLVPEARYRLPEYGIIANVYSIRTDQVIRAVVKCRTSLCTAPPTVYYTKFEDPFERRPDELVDYFGFDLKKFKALDGYEFTVDEGGTYLIGVSTQYFIEVGFVKDT
ncbi:MAG: hypothetical protein APG12_01572 [Candidatus Methanofastidiosum methylothiophilum]|uniref:Uncharacterized protein n=1 Tax=Candidatus Methanofastidiosum methylothiophilum TaxID=1705564 RepID=A0A150II12_9EURY|nr:MAG: hypothetical protein APG10_01559 [Candidatus Methanofastidiosum methylthiophilus]KYC46895.1 MAG: hypothetical protein APG11_01614 [Candidatus Methanofastidiosum methylthiophilus]KYC49324.1 MAG: hypothetical protein APG12_01572 [Candidatus Methanofastidiosum methylthiophilus]